MALSGVGIKV